MQQALTDSERKHQQLADLVDKLRQLSLDDVNTDDGVCEVDCEFEDDDGITPDPVSILQQARIGHPVRPIEWVKELKLLAVRNPLAAKLWISSFLCESAASPNGIMVALKFEKQHHKYLSKHVYPICRSLPDWSPGFTWPTNFKGILNKDKVRSLTRIYIFFCFT